MLNGSGRSLPTLIVRAATRPESHTKEIISSASPTPVLINAKVQLFSAKFCSLMAGGTLTAAPAALAAAGDAAGAAEEALSAACKHTPLLQHMLVTPGSRQFAFDQSHDPIFPTSYSASSFTVGPQSAVLDKQ